MVSRLVVSSQGRPVEIRMSELAGVESELPATSIARTSKVLEPSARLEKVCGPVQGMKGGGGCGLRVESNRHSNFKSVGLVTLSVPPNSNVAEVLPDNNGG